MAARILCIEDDRETAALVAEELNDHGFEVSIAYGGQEEAPIPDAVPTMPWAKLKRPVMPVISAITSAVSTPSTAPLMPSSA